MAQIELDEVTYKRLLLTARLLDEPVGHVVRRLLDRVASDESTAAPPGSIPAPDPATSREPKEEPVMTSTLTTEWIPIHKIYKGHRVEGSFNPSTHEIRLTTPPFANRYFNSPTGAAVAIVEHFSGDSRATNNTNGRKFWRLDSTRKDLRSIIGER